MLYSQCRSGMTTDLSRFREDTEADSVEVTKVDYFNRGQAKQQFKGRQRSVIQITVKRYRMAGSLRVRARRGQ
jgi:hypothetical protein